MYIFHGRVTYPVKIIFLSVIRSGSTLLNEPTAATTGQVSSSWLFKATRGSEGKQIGAYIEATENLPAWRNLSILCLLALILSEEKIGLYWQEQTGKSD